MTTLDDDSLYSRQLSTAGPRRQLKIYNAPPADRTVAYAMPVHGGTVLQTLQPAPSTVMNTEALVARPDRHASAAARNADSPLAANMVLGTAAPNAIDLNYRGITIRSDAARLHTRTEANMNRNDRVRERSDVDPYTGQKVDYYRQLPPEQNKDYRLPKETLAQANLRLVMLQGYDKTQPKRTRKEVLAAAPQPDNSHVESAMRARLRGEMAERVSRDLQLQKGGERPTWVRDTQRAFGFNGYQDMTRHIPAMTPTMRADTYKPLPSAGQVQNPNPANELKVRGHYNDQAKHPHVEKVTYRLPPGAPTPAPPQVLQQACDRLPSYRAGYETEGTRPNMGSVPLSHPPVIGTLSDPHRQALPPMDFNFLTGAPLDVGHAALPNIYDQTGRAFDGILGAVPAGLNTAQAFNIHTGAVPQTVVPSRQQRDQLPGLNAPMLQPQMDSRPPVLSQTQTHDAPYRASLPTQVALTHSSAVSSTQLPPRRDGSHDHMPRPLVPTQLTHQYAQSTTDMTQGTYLPPQSDLQTPHRVELPANTAHQYAQTTPEWTQGSHLPHQSDALPQHRPDLPTHPAQLFPQTTVELNAGARLTPQSDLQAQHRLTMPTDLFQARGASTQNVSERPPILHGVTDHPLPLRLDQLGPHASALAMQFTTVTLPTRVSSTSDLRATRRVDTAGAVPSGLGGHSVTAPGNLYQGALPPQHLEAQREQGRAHAPDFYALATAASGNGRPEPVFTPAHRQSDQYTDTQHQFLAAGTADVGGLLPTVYTGQDQQRTDQVLSNAQRGPAHAMAVGNLQLGEDTKIQSSGKRAGTGAVSATQYLHGGGEGSQHRSEGNMISLARLSVDSHSDRTRRSDLRSRAQQAGKTKRK